MQDQEAAIVALLTDLVGRQAFRKWLERLSDPDAEPIRERLSRQPGTTSFPRESVLSMIPFFERFQKTTVYKEYKSEKKKALKLAARERFNTLKLEFRW